MSIEDFVCQPGRERLCHLHPHYIDDSTWQVFEESGNGINKSMIKMMYGILKEPYPRYMSMPQNVQDMWFKQFAQDFNWDRDLTTEVYQMFDVEMVSEGLNDYWVQSETKAASSTNFKNQNSQRDGKGVATHNAGSTSFYTCEKQIETPKTKGRIFGLGKLDKRTRSHPTSSHKYNHDSELEQTLQEKDDRIEALKNWKEEEKQANKKREEEIAKKDVEMAKNDADMVKFMQDVLSRLPQNSSS
ncbi:hypothetical protein ISN45_Aa05g009310 [Arabidopsis thaliana x Arabidopsis arenosa]|uniref:Uncharacterized protein n=1 Tax=Arabidopsis thaliana x Arabidopsis arenosa TaxID=1240361 RepID=A0A8T1ZLL7_9BRAS|nr:hypothetical protein ISN45_Aa05g009310 [Arabidopsis thaliana x Arabidopsis arenosa]